MSKNLKLSYILLFAFSAILIAWKTLSNFFNGVAINFVGILGLIFAITLICFSDKSIMKRILDLFILACVFGVLELIIYFAFEFGIDLDYKTIEGFMVYQNIITFMGILFFAYISFRFISEYKNKKFHFIEIMLGNEKRTAKAKKVKATKEVSNGCLEEKPNKSHPCNNENQNTNETEVENKIETEVENKIETEE